MCDCVYFRSEACLLSPFDVPDVGLTLERGCHLFHPGVISNCVPPLHVTQ